MQEAFPQEKKKKMKLNNWISQSRWFNQALFALGFNNAKPTPNKNRTVNFLVLAVCEEARDNVSP